jgi:hypothetical protein
MYLANYAPEFKLKAPISGQTTNLKKGALVGKAVSDSTTQNGHLQLFSGFSKLANAVGILNEAHTATGNDVDVAGTTYNEPGRNGISASDITKASVHPVELIVPGRVVRIDYSLATGDSISTTSTVTTTALTLTSLEDDIEAAFLYVSVGTGIGQINYLTASVAGSATLKAAFGTNLDATTSKLVKILPRFHLLYGLTSDGTKLASQAAAGAMEGVILETYLVQNGREQILNPQLDSTLTGLNSLASLRIQADLLIRDSLPYTTS